MKKLTSLIIVFIVLFSSATAVYDTERDRALDTIGEYDAYAAIFRYFDFYYDFDLDDTTFPDYYAGVHFNDDGSLTMFTTDVSDAIQDNVKSICKFNYISFIKVDYSFNQLTAMEKTLGEHKDSLGIVRSTIDIDKNCINIYVQSNADILSQRINSNMISCYNYISDEHVSMTTIGDYANKEAIRDIEINDNFVANPFAATSYRAGLRTYNGTANFGTLGFLGLDNNSRKVLITHGHGVDSIGNSIKINGTTSTFTVLGVSDTLDASYAIVSSGTFENYIANTGSRMTATTSTSTFRSMSNPTVYFYGATTGSLKTSGYYAASSGSDYYLLSSSGNFSQSGDSGGPILVYTGGEYRLVGIIKGGDGSSWAQGIFLSSIKAAYRSATGYTLFTFVNSTSYS